MSTKTSIEWCDRTWNPTRGCSRVSAGCDHCYAMREARRHDHAGGAYEGLTRVGSRGVDWNGKVRLVPEMLNAPLRWRKPQKVFVNSMSDLFHESLPFEHIAAVYGVMAAVPHLTFQVLTKRPARRLGFHRWLTDTRGLPAPRPERANEIPPYWCWWHAADVLRDSGIFLRRGLDAVLGAAKRQWPLPNVWEGTSVEDQATANTRVPLLAETPAARRFISYEPALGPIDFTDGPLDPESTMGSWSMLDQIDWLIYGGESGPGARPNDIAWARSARDQCAATNTAFFCKQLGAHVLWNGIQGGGIPSWPRDTGHHDTGQGHWRKHLVDRKGGEMAEWPSDLRIRAFPESRPGV